MSGLARFKDLSISKKLLVVFAASIVFLMAVTAAGVMHMVSMKNSSMTIYEESFVEARKIMRLKENLERVRRKSLDLLLETNRDRIALKTGEIEEVSRAIDGNIESILLSAGFSQEIKDRVMKLKPLWESFKETRDREVLPAISKMETLKAASIIRGVQDQRFKEMARMADSIMEHENREAEKARALMKGIFAQGMILYATVSSIGILVILVFTLYISRDMGGRFRAIMEAVERFRAGELKIRIKDEGRDELGILSESLDRMFMRLYEDKLSKEQYIEILTWEAREKEKKAADFKRSEERFRGLVETTNDWVWETDSEGRYTYASPRVFDILGYRPDEVVGRTPFELMPPEEAARVLEIFAPLAGAGRPFTAIENRNLHKDGRVVVLETSGTPYFGPSGEFLGYRGIDRDITGRKAAEEEKAGMQAHLLQSEKMASIGQLAAGVAHEINNPVGFVSSNLNTLSGYIGSFRGLIERYDSMAGAIEAGDTGEAQRRLSSISGYRKEIDVEFAMGDVEHLIVESKDGLSRIKSIVKGLKDFSHPSIGEMEPSDINLCVENAVKLSWHEIKYKASLLKDLGELPPVVCRPQQITQVFLNIIINALHAIPDKGEISVRTFLSGPDAVIDIRDNGRGMSEEVKKKIFEPFFTTKPVGKGTGLGLSIVYGIIQDHKGAISVESAPGRGAAFTVRLPVRSMAAA